MKGMSLFSIQVNFELESWRFSHKIQNSGKSWRKKIVKFSKQWVNYEYAKHEILKIMAMKKEEKILY